MRTAVHTRRIVDPNWGGKLTGTVGKTTFGVLSSQDDRPEDVGDRGDIFTTRDKLFTIGRATYALRRSDYVGTIFMDALHAGRIARTEECIGDALGGEGLTHARRALEDQVLFSRQQRQQMS